MDAASGGGGRRLVPPEGRPQRPHRLPVREPLGRRQPPPRSTLTLRPPRRGPRAPRPMATATSLGSPPTAISVEPAFGCGREGQNSCLAAVSRASVPGTPPAHDLGQGDHTPCARTTAPP